MIRSALLFIAGLALVMWAVVEAAFAIEGKCPPCNGTMFAARLLWGGALICSSTDRPQRQ